MKEDSTAFGAVFEAVEYVLKLIDTATVAGWPAPPLGAVQRAQVALFGRPLIPNRHAVFAQPLGIGVAIQKPDQLVHHATKMDFLGSDERKPVI